jgi:hypothetical protein
MVLALYQNTNFMQRVCMYCGMSAESQNFETIRDGRCYGMALQTHPLLGNGSLTVM